MSTPSTYLAPAYLGVIIIWSTTPLAILWSSEDVGFIFGVSSRIVIAAFLALVVAAMLGTGMQWHKRALLAYSASGLGIFGGMITVYWSAQFIPTGWISVIFGLSPAITALMARIWLKEEIISRSRWFGMGIGMLGLAIIFGSSLQLSLQAALGVIVMVLSVSIHCASSIWVKRINAGVPAIVMASGGLVFSAPLFILLWFFTGAELPAHISNRSLTAIAYLSLFGSVFGFALYYYVLQKVEATRVALLTLITPICGLLLGHFLNAEPITLNIIFGSLLILSGLAIFELGNQARRIRAWLLRY